MSHRQNQAKHAPSPAICETVESRLMLTATVATYNSGSQTTYISTSPSNSNYISFQNRTYLNANTEVAAPFQGGSTKQFAAFGNFTINSQQFYGFAGLTTAGTASGLLIPIPQGDVSLSNTPVAGLFGTSSSADVGVYNQSSGQWTMFNQSGQQISTFQFTGGQQPSVTLTPLLGNINGFGNGPIIAKTLDTTITFYIGSSTGALLATYTIPNGRTEGSSEPFVGKMPGGNSTTDLGYYDNGFQGDFYFYNLNGTLAGTRTFNPKNEGGDKPFIGDFGTAVGDTIIAPSANVTTSETQSPQLFGDNLVEGILD